MMMIIRAAIAQDGASSSVPMHVEKIAVVPHRLPDCMREYGSGKRNNPTRPAKPNTVAEMKAASASHSLIMIVLLLLFAGNLVLEEPGYGHEPQETEYVIDQCDIQIQYPLLGDTTYHKES